MSDSNPAAPVDGPTPEGLVERVLHRVNAARFGHDDDRCGPFTLEAIALLDDVAAAIAIARTEAERARKQRDQLLAALTELRNGTARRLTLALGHRSDSHEWWLQHAQQHYRWFQEWEKRHAAERLIAGDKTE